MEPLTVVIINNLPDQIYLTNAIDSFLSNCSDQENVSRWLLISGQTNYLPAIKTKYPFLEIIVSESLNISDIFNLLYYKVKTEHMFYFGTNWEFKKKGNIIGSFSQIIGIDKKIRAVFDKSELDENSMQKIPQWNNLIPTLIHLNSLRALGKHDSNCIFFDPKILDKFTKYNYKVAVTIESWAQASCISNKKIEVVEDTKPETLPQSVPKEKLRIKKVFIDLSSSCNANCICCDVDKSNDLIVMDKDVIDILINQLNDVDFDEVLIGARKEPTLNKSYFYVVNQLKSRHINKIISLYTNFISPLQDCRANTIITRLYTLNKDVADKIYGVQNSLDNIFSNLTAFAKAHKDRKIHINYFNIAKFFKLAERYIHKSPLKNQHNLIVESDEFEKIKKFSNLYPNITVTREKINLISERTIDYVNRDPEYPCKNASKLHDQIYIRYDGAVSFCPNDTLCCLLHENIKLSDLTEIHKKFEEKIHAVITRRYYKFPCNNPKCCAEVESLNII